MGGAVDPSGTVNAGEVRRASRKLNQREVLVFAGGGEVLVCLLEYVDFCKYAL